MRLLSKFTLVLVSGSLIGLRTASRTVFAAFLFCVLASGRTQAGAVPVPGWSIVLNINDLGTVPTQKTAGTLVQTDTQRGGTTTGTAYANLGFDPSIGSSIVSTYTGPVPYGAPQGGADASMSYYFEVVGAAGKNVPVIFTANGGGGSSSLSGSEIENLGISGLGVSLQSGYLSGVPSLKSSFSVNEVLQVPADTIEEVSLTANCGLSTGFGGTVSAFIDPTFKIDPSFGGAGDYSIEFSPNLVVPDQPWTIMLLPLGAVSLFLLGKGKV